MKRTLYVSHGDKGGVGKSYLSMLAVEYLLQFGPVSLIEADPTQPDIGVRYMGLDNVAVGALPLNKAGDAENALSAFGEMLETSNADLVVVNLPAGAGETLDSMAEMIRDLSDALEYRLIVTYALEKNRVASDALIRSMAQGLLSVVDMDRRFVAYPEYKGKVESFDWYNRPERETAEIGELIVPSLGNRSALTKLEAARGRVADLIDKNRRPDGWMIIDQSSVFRWYKAGIAAIAPIFGGGE
ncbi:MAG: hypothetical protein M0003_13050 [Acidithiobacillus sp.]|nr:hypothetical protein [Acidithiobacillus sp.]